MGTVAQVCTIAWWEIRRFFTTMNRGMLPAAIVLLVILLLVSGYAARSGVHLQDGLYDIGLTSDAYLPLFGGDDRFVVYRIPESESYFPPASYGLDLIIADGVVFPDETDKGRAAAQALYRTYERYLSSVYSNQEDIFAAYPVWIANEYITSELDFTATESGQRIGFNQPGQRGYPRPEQEVIPITPPQSTPDLSPEKVRETILASDTSDSALSRYSDLLSADYAEESYPYQTPAMLSPPLPFDTIIFIFVFIFPLYFTSQFLMMSVMHERTLRQGEPLIAAPVLRITVIIGKSLPYAIGMLVISSVLLVLTGGKITALLPLIPIILFFLSSALLIGMVSRSFRELSFISIFFSTIATAYLFFPSIFANIHVISLLSPVTLIVMDIQGTGYSAMDYLYSTALFYLTGGVMFYLGIVSFTEEHLFTQKKLVSKILDLITAAIHPTHPWGSVFFLTILSIPFVFMAQMMYLVLFFNLPMPFSLVAILVLAAATEEIVKSLLLMALFNHNPIGLSWPGVAIASVLIGLGFLLGEKLLLVITLSQITSSIFGSLLFQSASALWSPFLLHSMGIFCVAVAVKRYGNKGYIPGLFLAIMVHCIYNALIIRWALA
ncbi:MAG: PrsW family intramembrane metalloprotease [Methanospirillaceae archaeon]|nr:PrsW family intramembrane metalloprotease [Methanospirillaceae archaeon]